MRHIDLFSGIGGFSYAVDQVWDNVEHVFCEIDPYCQALLKLRFPKSVIYGNIKDLTVERFIADTEYSRLSRTEDIKEYSSKESEAEARQKLSIDEFERTY